MTRDRDAGRDGTSRGGEDFASRWSRLKRETRAPAAETPGPAAEGPAEGSAGAPEIDGRSDEEILSELGLPDPDTLKRGDDFKAFMASTVPARIRNRALRRLWTSNPVLANLDRLVDYDDDFTDAAMVPAILNTGYKVGRGWMEDDDGESETAAGAEEAAPGQDSPAEDVPGEDAAGEHASPESPADEREAGPVGRADPAALEDGPETAAGSGRPGLEQAPEGAGGHVPPRRMRFRFAEE